MNKKFRRFAPKDGHLTRIYGLSNWISHKPHGSPLKWMARIDLPAARRESALSLKRIAVPPPA
jgi:hypothetical protein